MTFFNLFAPKKTAYPCHLQVRVPKDMNLTDQENHFKKVVKMIIANKNEFHVKFDVEFFYPFMSGMVNGEYVYTTILGTVYIAEHAWLSESETITHVSYFISNMFYEEQVKGDLYGSFSIGYGNIFKD